MRKLAVTAVALCVVAGIVLALLPWFLDVNHYRPRVQAELQSRLGRPVSLGNIKASLLPPSLIVKDVVVAEDPRFGAGPFAKTQELDVRVALIPLLRKDLQMSSLRLISPDISLIKDPSGQWNFASLGQVPVPEPSQTPAKRSAPQQPSEVTPQPGVQPSAAAHWSLDHLKITNGRLRYFDQQNKFQNTYDNIDVLLDNVAPGKPFAVDAAVHIAGRADQRIRVTGTAGPITAGSAMIPFSGNVELKQVSLGDLRRVANIAALEGYNGVASGSLKARTDKDAVHAEGALKVEDPQIKATKLGYSVTLDFRLDDDLNSGVIRIEAGTLKLDPTPVSITGTISTTRTPAQLDLRVTMQGASLLEVARLAAAAGVAFSSGTNIKGTLNADISARGPANNLALNGSLKASSVEISGGQAKQPVSVPQLDLVLTPTAISSSPFVAKTGGTLLNAQFALKDYTGQAPSMSASIQTNHANVGDMLSMASAHGVSAVEGMSGAGLISLNLTAAGPLKSSSAMAFNGSGTLQNASLNVPSLTKPLNVRSANVRFSQNSIMFENVQASLDQSNASGSLSVHDFAAPQVRFVLDVDKLDLAAMRRILAPPGGPVKKAEFQLIPRAYAQKTMSEPSLITKAAGSGTITVGTLTYEQLVLNGVKANVTLDRGVIRLSPQTSALYGGQQTGELVLDTRVTPAEVTVATKLQNVDANKLVSSMSSVKDTLYGLMAGNTSASFRAVNGAKFAQSLNGRLELDLSNGRITRFDLLNELAVIGRFLNASSAIPQQPFTDVTKMTGTFDVLNGVAQTRDLRAVTPGANLAATGTVDLATGALNLHLTAVMSKDFSQKVGGNNVGGFTQTALTNSKGELVMPVIVTGTFDSPRIVPDVQEIARMKLQKLLPSFGNPGDVTSGILGAVLGGNRKGGPQQQPAAVGDQQQNQQQAQPANPLVDLLNSVMQDKKKRKQPPSSPPPP